MLTRLKTQFKSFPLSFRVLVASAFIDRVGGALIYPFLSLYVAQKFNVGMTQIGLLFGLWSLSGMVGSMIGGALSDKFGRKVILILGLIFSAASALVMGLVNDMRTFYFLAAFAGIFTDIGQPAQQAMVADLLKGEKRSEGFALLRVVMNLAVAIGPAIGGILAGVSYLLLFIIDACTSSLTALIVLKYIPETRPADIDGQPTESIMKTLTGYRKVAKDGLFMAFIAVSIITVIVYVQMYSTLPVYLNRVHGIPAQGFGYLMSMNAIMVVTMQFWISKRFRKIPPMLMMVAASALYGIGSVIFGFMDSYGYFMVGMAIVTIGEMLHVPTAQTLVAFFAPEEMRGRYMAAYSLGWTIPNSVGPLLAGLVMDNYNPDLVWYLAGALSLVPVVGFWLLNLRTQKRFEARETTEVIEL